MHMSLELKQEYPLISKYYYNNNVQGTILPNKMHEHETCPTHWMWHYKEYYLQALPRPLTIELTNAKPSTLETSPIITEKFEARTITCLLYRHSSHLNHSPEDETLHSHHYQQLKPYIHQLKHSRPPLENGLQCWDLPFSTVTCRMVCMTKWRVLVRMSGFISTSVTHSLFITPKYTFNTAHTVLTLIYSLSSCTCTRILSLH
jgi:hypothetical protein